VKRNRLRILAQARREIDEAFNWYFERSADAAEAFLNEIGDSLAQIAVHPQLYPAYTRNTRRRILSGFPYSVIFQEKDDIVLVVAVAHAKRRPDYWRRRI
jgi:plasmid stabilization system protein ParE